MDQPLLHCWRYAYLAAIVLASNVRGLHFCSSGKQPRWTNSYTMVAFYIQGCVIRLADRVGFLLRRPLSGGTEHSWLAHIFMIIALVYWIAHRSVVSLMSHGFTGCYCNGHCIVGIRRVGPYCVVAVQSRLGTSCVITSGIQLVSRVSSCNRPTGHLHSIGGTRTPPVC